MHVKRQSVRLTHGAFLIPTASSTGALAKTIEHDETEIRVHAKQGRSFKVSSSHQTLSPKVNKTDRMQDFKFKIKDPKLNVA